MNSKNQKKTYNAVDQRSTFHSLWHPVNHHYIRCFDISMEYIHLVKCAEPTNYLKGDVES
jgi:hypothetical protein